MHRSFKLHHRRHTGKLLHHRHTSYMALVVVLVISGFFMWFTESQARAATLTVTATVPAPIPPGQPLFTAPANNTVTNDPDVHFEGICPVIDPAVIIALYDGSDMIGSAPCQTDGTFQIDATISEGVRSIVATVVTITGDNGESSDPLTITYTPPSPPIVPSPGTPSTPPITKKNPLPVINPEIEPLSIIGQSQFVTYGRQTLAVWKGSFQGGVTPYTVIVDWGDGEKQIYTLSSHELQTYMHSYKRAGNYDLAITITDKDGRTLTKHFAVVSTSPAQTDTSLAGLVNTEGTINLGHVVTVLYAALLTSVLWLWRYEFLKHRKLVAVPMHYSWQKNHYSKKKAGRTPRR